MLTHRGITHHHHKHIHTFTYTVNTLNPHFYVDAIKTIKTPRQLYPHSGVFSLSLLCSDLFLIHTQTLFIASTHTTISPTYSQLVTNTRPTASPSIKGIVTNSSCNAYVYHSNYLSHTKVSHTWHCSPLCLLTTAPRPKPVALVTFVSPTNVSHHSYTRSPRL